MQETPDQHRTALHYAALPGSSGLVKAKVWTTCMMEGEMVMTSRENERKSCLSLGIIGRQNRKHMKPQHAWEFILVLMYNNPERHRHQKVALWTLPDWFQTVWAKGSVPSIQVTHCCA